MTNEERKCAIIDLDSLPEKWPTNRHAPEFWEELGRTIATFGFLEEVLGKAIFAHTATRRYQTEAEARAAFEKWLPTLENALKEPLNNLVDALAKAVRENTENTTTNFDELAEDLKKASKIRNVICHGSWRSPDGQGFSLPLFVNKQKESFETPIDVAFLRQVQRHVAELACSVINTVTHMGFQFPGGIGPGEPIFPRK
ncbi:hypothetical protein [Rhodovulum euryhalinum]|uniref:hypothetical protein n=1 Tax=Rhodovulum euryhalinum TaxID=35805 RepID=UPI00104D88C8|nr:hypothetical protein [Rhodovulum euryhalinum]